MTGIYYITNKENGKIYVGCSGNVFKRWNQHLDMLRSGRHHSYKLQKDYDIFGESVFEFEFKESCAYEDMYRVEAIHMREVGGTRGNYNVAKANVMLDSKGENYKITKPLEFVYMDKRKLDSRMLVLIDNMIVLYQELYAKYSHEPKVLKRKLNNPITVTYNVLTANPSTFKQEHDCIYSALLYLARHEFKFYGELQCLNGRLFEELRTTRENSKVSFQFKKEAIDLIVNENKKIKVGNIEFEEGVHIPLNMERVRINSWKYAPNSNEVAIAEWFYNGSKYSIAPFLKEGIHFNFEILKGILGIPTKTNKEFLQILDKILANINRKDSKFWALGREMYYELEYELVLKEGKTRKSKEIRGISFKFK